MTGVDYTLWSLWISCTCNSELLCISLKCDYTVLVNVGTRNQLWTPAYFVWLLFGYEIDLKCSFILIQQAVLVNPSIAEGVRSNQSMWAERERSKFPLTTHTCSVTPAHHSAPLYFFMSRSFNFQTRSTLHRGMSKKPEGAWPRT